jgi:hypothetical protein
MWRGRQAVAWVRLNNRDGASLMGASQKIGDGRTDDPAANDENIFRRPWFSRDHGDCFLV